MKKKMPKASCRLSCVGGVEGQCCVSAPLLEEFPNFFAEILSYHNVEDGVENAVEESQIHEDMRADVVDGE